MDREKVIKKAERIMCSTVDRDIIDSFCEDVVALLEEQEPKQVEAEVINEIDRLYRCPSCHISMILRKQPYCHSCGQAVKWE